MAITIETPRGEEALSEFVHFYDRVYAERPIRWPSIPAFQLPILCNQSPFAEERTMRPYIARDDHTIVARTLAVIDHRYNRHWNERLGHINMFEALPGPREPARRLLREACAWLRQQGAEAARAGFGLLEFPFVIDDYDSLPPSVLRHNPPYYHCLLKDAGFETEKGWVDYRIDVTSELLTRWHEAIEASRRNGCEIVPLRDVPAARRLVDFTELWNDAFKAHWGQWPLTEAEVALLLAGLAPTGMLDTSVFAYDSSGPVGVLWVTPEATATALCTPGRAVRDSERLNFLGIGVRETARGRGIALAMASYAFVELVRRGATHVSYTLVLDDNTASRRTGERLGGYVRASYLTYRRDLGR